MEELAGFLMDKKVSFMKLPDIATCYYFPANSWKNLLCQFGEKLAGKIVKWRI
jgi:hypothetical protein